MSLPFAVSLPRQWEQLGLPRPKSRAYSSIEVSSELQGPKDLSYALLFHNMHIRKKLKAEV